MEDSLSSRSSKSFPASYDTTTKFVSGFVFVMVAAAPVITGSALAAGLGVLIVFLAYAYSARAYAISNRSIVVQRLIGNVIIPLDGIREIRKATADDLRFCIRLWGSGGLFGYYGLFRTSALGKSTWYVTNRRNMLVVVTASKTMLVSPDDPDAFLSAVGKPAACPPAAPMPVRSFGSVAFIGILIAAVAGIAAIAYVAFAILYAPGPPAYTLTPQTLAIHDRFYPVTLNASAVDAGNVRIIDFSVDVGWRPVARTNGFANKHYRSGWFKIANGRKVRMYRAGSQRLVLLPPKGEADPVLIEVTQPERFVEQLRREWPQ